MRSPLIVIVNISLMILLLCSTYIYAETIQSKEPIEDGQTSGNKGWTNQSEQETTLTIWSQKAILEGEIETFQEANPHITIEFTNLQGEPRISERYLNALAEGAAPDILVLSHTMLGSFNSVDLIADLSQSHLDLDKYRESMGEYLWGIHQSLDGGRTIALPFEAYPYVLYYRYDILEEYGYPSEPGELAVFLENPDNWLKLAKDLRQNNQWTLQWENDLLTLVNYGQFFFDREIDYQRSSELYHRIADTTWRFKDLSANTSIWNSNGQEMIRNHQFVMIMMASYGEDVLEEWVPDQAGKWRVTRLPLGIEAVEVYSGFSLAVTAQSENKAAAAKFLEHVMNISTVLNWYETAPVNAFLGDQDSGALYLEILRSQSPNAIPTPLDDRLFDMWYSTMEQSRQLNYPYDAALDAATQEVMDVTSVAQEQLKQYLQVYSWLSPSP